MYRYSGAQIFRPAIVVLVLTFAVYINVGGQNSLDASGQKTGKWQYFNKEGQLTEEGEYRSGKKEGIWKAFYPDGTIKYEITFKDGVANGPAKFYFPDGSLWEEGTWKEAFWVGDYRLYHPGGKPAYEFHYNDWGKREGEQKYYYADGTIKFRGKWQDGAIDGKVEVYDSSGKLQAIRNYENGSFESTDTKPSVLPESNEREPDRIVSPFHGTGYHTAYRLDGRIYQKGYYREGILYDGEEFIYDSSGVLRQIRVYENGKLVRIKSGREIEGTAQ